MKTATGRKVVLTDQQKTAVNLIFPQQAQAIITEAEKELGLDVLKRSIADLAKMVNSLDGRLTGLEIKRGFTSHMAQNYFTHTPAAPTLAKKYYKSNGTKPEGLAPNYFPKEDS